MKNNISSCPLELLMAANSIKSGNRALANTWLKSLQFEDDISIICKEALLSEDGEHLVNLYDSEQDREAKQIDLFDLIFKHVPSVIETTQMALQTLTDFYGCQKGVIQHINIGIGKGHFEKGLFTQLANQNKLKEVDSIHIIGVDIDLNSLEKAKQQIAELQGLFPDKTISFVPIVADIETIDDDFLTALRIPNAALGIISAFTLHHIRTMSGREAILKSVAQLKPDLFLLIEPNSDHFIPDLVTRTKNCWEHFQKAFELIDNQSVSPKVKQAIKYEFFGREIQNILSTDESKRFEKHEAMETWHLRLQQTGFQLSESPKTSLPKHFAQFGEGVLSYCFEEVPLVTLFSAKV